MQTNHPSFSSLRVFACGLILLVFAIAPWGCSSKEPESPKDPKLDPAQARKAAKFPVPEVKFTDITAKAGIRFQHTCGGFGKKLLPEALGSGVAFLDFDNDGHQDLLFINSCHWPGYEPKDKPAPTLALYRNKGDGTFEDVTEAAGLKVTLYGLGVTVGDYDNDGWPDLFITAVGGNRLFKNVADGKGGRKFEE